MVTLITLRHTLNENDLQKNSRAKKAYDELYDKIRENIVKEQAKNRQMLKKLLKNVESNKLTDTDKKKLEFLNITKDHVKKLEELIELTKIINVLIVDIDEEDLPKSLQTSLKRYRKQQDMEQVKLNAEPNKVITEIKKEIKEQNDIKTKQLESIEPLQLFTLLHYVKDKKLREKLQKILNLNKDMLPNDYLVFENLNKIIEKEHVTGQYYDYTIKKSQLAKDFDKIEAEFLEKLDLDDFKSIPTAVIQKFKRMNYEINSILSIQQTFNPNVPKNKNIYIKLFVKILHDCYTQIPTIKGKKVFAEYLLHTFDILEVRNKLTKQTFLDLVKEAAERKGMKTTLSKEVKGLMPKELSDTITKLKMQDMQPIEQVELVDELGTPLLPEETTVRHINDDEIFNDDIFDDDVLEEALL